MESKYGAAVTPGQIAREVELEMGDALADLTMIVGLVARSPDWTQVPTPDIDARNAIMSIRVADRWLGGWPVHEWHARMSGFDSPAFRKFGQQWIVTTFSRWEHVFRARIVAAGGSGASDLFGDLRLLRNDIVHHDAVATAKNAGKCKILARFETGEPIFLAAEDLVIIMDELASWVESLGGTSQGHIHRDRKSRGE